MKYGALLFAVLLSLMPATAQASCSGLLDCAFGWTERTEVRAERDVEKARIEAAAQAEVTRLQGEADARIREAEAKVEEVRQMQFKTEAERAIRVAEVERQAEEYKAMIAALTSKEVANISAMANMQIATLQESAKVSIEGITQTGLTERARIISGWTFAAVAIIVAAVVLAYWLKRRPMVVLLAGANRRPSLPAGDAWELPLSDEYLIDTEEVANGYRIVRK